MNVERRRIDGFDDQDVHTSWRKVAARFSRAGVAAWAKRQTRRRERREHRADTEARLREEGR